MRKTGITLFAWLLALPLPLPLQAAQLLVVNKDDNNLQALDVRTGQSQQIVPLSTNPHEVIVPDCRFVAVSEYHAGRGNSVALLDPQNLKLTRRLQLPDGAGPHGLAALADGRLLITAEGIDQLLVSDAQRTELHQRIDTLAKVSHMVIAPIDGRRAYVSNIGSDSVTVIDLAAGKIIKHLPTGEGAEGMALSTDGARLWVTNRGADTVSVIDTASLQIIKTLESKGFPIRVALHPGGHLAAVSNATESTLSIFDARSLELLQTVDVRNAGLLSGLGPIGRSQPIGLLFSPSGKQLFVALTLSGEIGVIDTDSWTLIDRWKVGNNPDGLAWLDCG